MWNSITLHHPRVGFTFMPNVKSRIPCETGGYLVRTNAAGFRSDREFVKQRPAGTYRALLFGDSQTAGNGVSNGQRYGDLVENVVPGLEIFNYGFPSTGPDQDYLIYRDCADVERDLVIIGLHVKAIGRLAQRFVHWGDPSGQEMIYAKPYFSLDDGELVLHHVPVPKTPIAKDAVPPEVAPHVYWGVPHAPLRKLATQLGVRDLLQKFVRFQPVPEFDSPDNIHWHLLRKILSTWINSSPVPVLVFLLPMWCFVEESSDPTNYQARLRELASETGCHLHDPLPDLWKYSREERRAFRFQTDTHLTLQGHQALAASLAPAIRHIIDVRESRLADGQPI